MDQIFKGGGRSEPDPAALLKYEFASAPTKVDDNDDGNYGDDGGDGYDLDSLLKYEFASAPTKVDQDDLDEADDSDDEYGNPLLKCYFALVPSKVVLS